MKHTTRDATERHWWTRLLAADGIGPSTARRLVSKLGSACAVCAASSVRLHHAVGCSWAESNRICKAIKAVDLEREQQWLALNDGTLISMEDPDYPASMIELPDPPGLLRVQGSLPASGTPCVAVIGTRRCSAYGLRQAGRFTQGLVEAGCCVVSGGARGIDAEVHRMTLRCGGVGLVVLGSGLARRYPPEHDGLFDDIIERGGAVLSEVPVHQPPRPGLFPRRNRIISGLALGVVVVEAPLRSGAMITARLAVEEHGRDAMVVPGFAGSSRHAGGHRAVQQGWAHLVTSPDDVLAILLQDHQAASQLL